MFHKSLDLCHFWISQLNNQPYHNSNELLHGAGDWGKGKSVFDLCYNDYEHRSALRVASRFGFAEVPNASKIELGLLSTRSELG